MALTNQEKAQLEIEIKKLQHDELVEATRKHAIEKSQKNNVTRTEHILRREQQKAANDLQVKEDFGFSERTLERDEKVAMELDRIKREELKKMKERQILHESSHELRELASKLRIAYTAKELSAQIAQRQAEKLQDKVRERESYKTLQTAWLKEAELKQQLAQEEIYKKASYKQQLQDQMIVNEKQRRCMFEQYLQEKKLIDDIVQRMHDEDIREMEDKMRRRQKTREEMDAFKEARRIWRKKQRDVLELENQKIQEYVLTKANEMQIREEKKNELEEVKAKLSANIAKQMDEAEAKRREREEIVMELREEEQKQAQENRNRAEIEKQIRQRIEVRESLHTQMLEREHRMKQEAEEDARLKEELIAKMAEDERLEQFTAEKRRLKMLQLRRDVEQMIIDRRQQKAENMQMEMKLLEQEEMERKERVRIIEEERMRMLKEHAQNVFGYIPRGVLRADDYSQLGSDLVKKQK